MDVSSAIVDWIQFTVPVTAGTGRAFKYLSGEPGQIPDELFSMLLGWGMSMSVAESLTRKSGAENCSASAPYNSGLRSGGVFWYWHDGSPEVDTILCQVTGEGCRRLREAGTLMELIREVHNRVSRIDVCMDFATEEPLEGLFETAKRVSFINSRSGQTFYVGSMKSDKYARVYRYSAPHPRAGFARLECVYRRKFAQEAARYVVEMGVERAFSSMVSSNRITLRGDIAAAVGSGERMRVAPPVNTGAETTLRWLMEAAAPAFKRLVADGVIDEPERWLREYFMGVR